VKRRRVTGKESDNSASASATEITVEVPVMVNSKDLSEGDVLTVFRTKPKAIVKTAPVQLGALMKTKKSK
jgi:hypothetical protein